VPIANASEFLSFTGIYNKLTNEFNWNSTMPVGR